MTSRLIEFHRIAPINVEYFTSLLIKFLIDDVEIGTEELTLSLETKQDELATLIVQLEVANEKVETERAQAEEKYYNFAPTCAIYIFFEFLLSRLIVLVASFFIFFLLSSSLLFCCYFHLLFYYYLLIKCIQDLDRIRTRILVVVSHLRS